MKHTLFVLALIFCLGIFCAELAGFKFALFYIPALVLLFLSFLWRKRGLVSDIFIYGLVFLLGGARLASSWSLPKCHIEHCLRAGSGSLITVRGFIESQPCLKNNQTSFIFQAQEIRCASSRIKACGKILVKIKGRGNWYYGETLVISGHLYRPFRSGNFQRGNYRDYLARQGIYSIMSVKIPGRICSLNKNQGSLLKRFALGLKIKMENIIYKYVSGLAASILDAMILGERMNIPILINDAMIKSGTVHILVVSGFNVGIVGFIIILFLKLMRLRRRWIIFVSAAFLAIYCLVTGASTPVVRATVMAIVFISAFLLKREPDIYNSCGLAALFILGINPQQLFDLGFQLSFLSVISIVYFSGRLQSFLRLDVIKSRPLKFILNSCLVSFSAWLGTMGLVAYYFKVFSPITVLANLFIASLAVLITLCGFALIIAGLVCPPLASLFAHSNELVVILLLKINAFLISLPAAYFYLS